MTRILRLLFAVTAVAAMSGATASGCEPAPTQPPGGMWIETTVTGSARAHVKVTVAGETRLDARRALPWSRLHRVHTGDRIVLTAAFVDAQVGDRLSCRIWGADGHTLDSDSAEYPLDAAAECATTIGEPA